MKIFRYGVLRFVVSIVFFLFGDILDVSACQSGGDTYCLEMDAQGNIVSVWQNKCQADGYGVIYGATKLAGGDWSAAMQISNNGCQCEKPLVEVAANGNAIAVWLSNDEQGSMLVSSQLPFEGSWTKPTIVSDFNIEEVMNNSYGITLDDNGNLTAFWTGYMIDGSFPPGQQVFRSAAGVFGGAWSAPETLTIPQY